ncbi:MAG: hypothetical protein L0H41_03400 [Microlunatus sp.]|nr:hypothetical protein [Microlunatus sp.]MDN5772062.1 hypothetical protein [Microlunatus sp.]MDN5803086.1 hypothetical protein [Microlunatus sp.]
MTRPPAVCAWPTAASRSGPALSEGWIRLARASVLGGSSLILATAAHAVGGGVLPRAGLLILVGIGLALVSVALTARRCRFGALVGILAVEQIALHLLFAASTTATCASAGGLAAAHAGHAMTGGTLVCGPGAGHAMPGLAMWLAHLGALLATAWLLACGERWLWRIADRLTRYVATRPMRCRRRRTVLPSATGEINLSVDRWAQAPARAPPQPEAVFCS